jgi:hypothetical protein
MKTQDEIRAIEEEIKAAREMDDWEAVVDLKISLVNSRGAKKRGWVVLRKSWLTSSINYRMSLAEIAVFSKIIVMADEFGPVPGLISDNDCRPMPHEYLAHQACCPPEIFEECLKKAVEDNSIYENSHGIFVTHFDDYQFTEYDRQKPYREAKKARNTIDPGKFTRGRLGKIAEENTRRKLQEIAAREADNE